MRAPEGLRLHMRPILTLVFFGLVTPVACWAQSACVPGALGDAAKTAIAIRHQLHGEAVSQFDPKVPAPVAAQLMQLKAALTAAADAAFACAPASAEPEQIQRTLAMALHANRTGATETVYVTKTKKDLGAYGSDLAVQVLPLYNSPKYFEVDFRYGVECGDDNLLMVYQFGAGSNGGWGQVLRWGAPSYATVADAYGDFVLLTPLSGFPDQRNWRFVVAHGQPGCNGASGPSRFDLDLLEPTADPAEPRVVWHLERPYIRSQEPRLVTTEDTLSFELLPPQRRTAGRRGPAAPGTSFRYRVSKDNKIEPLDGTPDAGTTPGAQAASTNSPR